MRWHREVVVVAGAVFWAGAGFIAVRAELLHPSVLSAWLLSGALLWGPTPASLPTSMYDERRPLGACGLALAILLSAWIVWAKAGHTWL